MFSCSLRARRNQRPHRHDAGPADSLELPYFSLSVAKNPAETARTAGLRAWLLLGTCVLTITSAGTFLVYHNYPLSLDEYLAEFQARIFVSGISPPPSAQWQEFGDGLAPNYCHRWDQPCVGFQLPAGLVRPARYLSIAPRAMAGQPVAGRGIAGDAGRDQGPGGRLLEMGPVGGRAVLATSSQLIVNAMTLYAMTAHLFFNLSGSGSTPAPTVRD